MTFNIIRHYGDLDKAEVDGVMVYRKDRIWIPEWNDFVKCAEYDDHFLFTTPHNRPNAPVHQCTCGSIGVITGPSGYVWDASPQGKLMVCLFHATYGHHQDGSRWI